MMNQLVLSSCMAPNMDFLARDLAGYLSKRLSLPVDTVLDIPWQERERRLDEGSIDLCWLCGLPYVRKADQNPGKINLLVAPVMAGSRYRGEPVYFSDVVVHRDSPFRNLEELRGASWAYNEPGSHSGYGVVRYMLAVQGKTLDFFGRVVESGAHQASLAMILDRQIDASAIDSTVLEMELVNHPEIASQIRVIDTFGPSPIPPWVVSGRLPVEIQSAIRSVLIGMEDDAEGQEILNRARIARFTAVLDRDYDPIRNMARTAFGE